MEPLLLEECMAAVCRVDVECALLKFLNYTKQHVVSGKEKTFSPSIGIKQCPL